MDVADLVHTRRVSRWLREPLGHFVVLGAALFLLHRVLAPVDGDRRIAVSASVRRALVDEHVRRFNAPPTTEQVDAMLDRWIDDEVRVREALALGLDQGDIIVRRRLIQKMDFVLEDAAPLARATDAELAAYLAAHPERYADPTRVSLVHVFAANDRRDGGADGAIAAWREQLVAGAAPETLGDPFLRGREFPARTESELAGVFGPVFAQSVMALPVGEWSAPIRSSFGLHVVRVTARVAGRAPSLDAVRTQVERDWRDERRTALDQEALAQLRARYRIDVEAPAP